MKWISTHACILKGTPLNHKAIKRLVILYTAYRRPGWYRAELTRKAGNIVKAILSYEREKIFIFVCFFLFVTTYMASPQWSSEIWKKNQQPHTLPIITCVNINITVLHHVPSKASSRTAVWNIIILISCYISNRSIWYA